MRVGLVWCPQAVKRACRVIALCLDAPRGGFRAGRVAGRVGVLLSSAGVCFARVGCVASNDVAESAHPAMAAGGWSTSHTGPDEPSTRWSQWRILLWRSGLGVTVVGRRAACPESAARRVPAPLVTLAVSFKLSTAFVPGRAGARQSGVRPPKKRRRRARRAHRLTEGRPDRAVRETAGIANVRDRNKTSCLKCRTSSLNVR